MEALIDCGEGLLVPERMIVAPSVGTSVTADVVRRKTMTDPRSASPGFVHATVTCV